MAKRNASDQNTERSNQEFDQVINSSQWMPLVAVVKHGKACHNRRMNQPIAQLYQYCPVCGSKGDASGSNPFRCPACDHTHYFSPVTAVGAIITDEQGLVLLITRAKDPGKGKYGLPGGFVDPNESLEEALRREVLEEINLQATSVRYLTSFPNTYAYSGAVFPVTDGFFVCEVDSFDSIAAQEGEITDFHFLEPNKEVLDNLAFESNRLALEFFLANRSA